MSRIDPSKVLLDRSFMAAIVDESHPAHDECIELYRDLLDRFEREEILLVAVSTDLRDVERGPSLTTAQKAAYFLHRNHRGVFAPVDPLYVGGQHRRAARGVETADPADGLTLVMCERHDIRRIAAATDAFDHFRIERVTVAAD
jgi:predicted nucleic acid-binding protein